MCAERSDKIWNISLYSLTNCFSCIFVIIKSSKNATRIWKQHTIFNQVGCVEVLLFFLIKYFSGVFKNTLMYTRNCLDRVQISSTSYSSISMDASLWIPTDSILLELIRAIFVMRKSMKINLEKRSRKMCITKIVSVARLYYTGTGRKRKMMAWNGTKK